MNTHEDLTYTTSDMPLAAYLALYFPVESLDGSNIRRVAFRFAKTPELLNAVADFWADRANVEPKLYFYQLKSLKSRIYAHKYERTKDAE